MRFNGRLQTESDPDGWLKSELSISGSKVELISGDDVLGSWPVGQVKAERIEGDRFELYLGDDRAVFAADDALAFSYEALPKLTRKPLAEAAQGFRKLLGGGRKNSSPAPAEAPAVVAPSEPAAIVQESDPDEIPANVKRLRDLIEVAKANRPEEMTDEPEPVGDDFRLTEPAPIGNTEPGPLWSIPATSYTRHPAVAEEPKPVSLSIVEGSPVDLAPAFAEASDLSEEIDRLAQQIRRSRLTPTQTEASISLIRSLRNLLG